MSDSVRTAIAAAASTVDGVTCSPYFRQSTKPGFAMVRKDGVRYPPNGFGAVITWQVVVFLPQDMTAAEKFLDETVPQLVTAVSSELRVTDVMPQQLALDSGTVPIALIQGQREEEV